MATVQDIEVPDSAARHALAMDELPDAVGDKMVLNMGPSHPATHGVLRILLELDGEKITKADPDVGYLHRGDEKIAENMTYTQFIPYTDRLDYLAPLANNVAYALAVEKALGIHDKARGLGRHIPFGIKGAHLVNVDGDHTADAVAVLQDLGKPADGGLRHGRSDPVVVGLSAARQGAADIGAGVAAGVHPEIVRMGSAASGDAAAHLLVHRAGSYSAGRFLDLYAVPGARGEVSLTAFSPFPVRRTSGDRW